MNAVDYRKLCPNSGRVLRHAAGDARAAGHARCDVCGHVVDVQPDPGSGRSLLFAMHDRDEGRRASRPPRGSP